MKDAPCRDGYASGTFGPRAAFRTPDGRSKRARRDGRVAGVPLWLRWTLASAVGAGLAAALFSWPRGHIQGGTLWGVLKLLGPLLLFGPLLSAPQMLLA